MRLTISFIATADILNLDLPGEMTVVDLKALIANDLPHIPADAQHIYFQGKLLNDDARTLEACGLSNDDMLMVYLARPAAAAPGGAGAAGSSRRPTQQQQYGQDTEQIRLQVLGNPNMLASLREMNPELAEVVNNPQRFGEIFRDMERKKHEAEQEKAREIAMLNEDPFNIEAQKRIEELIRQEQVMENLQTTIEHHPEAFGRVTMLYIPVEVNKIAVKAFVDSGAQATVMSPSCAERCGIMRLVDSRYAGIARGVGTAKILGRVHSAQIQIGQLFLPCSFTVMEGKDVDLLLGLDMLKRHQACIDLTKGVLAIQGLEVPFLGESEIPKGFGDESSEEPTVEGPGGAQLGARTGAIVQPPAGAIPESQPTPAAASPAQVPQTAQAPQLPPRQTQVQQYPAETIAQLEALGFSKAEAVQALDAANGNVEVAASFLFQ